MAKGGTNTGGVKFERNRDKSVYWTLTFIVPKEKLEAAGIPISRDRGFLNHLSQYQRSRELNDAIEPLFNDISDRAKLGKINDFLFDTPAQLSPRQVCFHVPESINWKTEGVEFKASPAGLAEPKTMSLRRFWYAYADGSLSYNLSFRYDYAHQPADFYFLSLLQKFCSPKEFSVEPAPNGEKRWDATSLESGIFPLTKVRISDTDGQGSSDGELFWVFVERMFNEDAADFYSHVREGKDKASSRGLGRRREAAAIPDFKTLVPHIRSVDLRNLVLPLCRAMFFFQDQAFFDRLLPGNGPGGKGVEDRALHIQHDCYLPYVERIREKIEVDHGGNQEPVRLDAEYWHWVQTRPEYESLSAAEVAEIQKTIPAFEKGRADCLHYLFLSGFNQNIIDFMNQDASEIQDGTSPIYPDEDSSGSAFFVRYANQNALITYAGNCRSLEVGNDYIGTCPYAYLIHTLGFYNEYLTYMHEKKTARLIKNVGDFNRRSKLSKATGTFYSYRLNDYMSYQQARYNNVFRYSTEREVFATLEELRGTNQRNRHIETLISNIEKQTRDKEARITKRDETFVNLLLGTLGIFGFFQLVFQWLEKYQSMQLEVGASLSWYPPFLVVDPDRMIDAPQVLAVVALYASLVAAFGLLTAGVFFLLRMFWHKLS